jgi:hypothetical protein
MQRIIGEYKGRDRRSTYHESMSGKENDQNMKMTLDHREITAGSRSQRWPVDRGLHKAQKPR